MNNAHHCFIAIASTMLTGAAMAAPVAVGSQTDYDNATGPANTTIDTFDGSTQNAVSITTDIGIVSTLTGGTPFDPPDHYYNHPDFDLSEFGFALDRGGSVATRNVVWTFPEEIIGFSGEFVSVTGIDVGIGSSAAEVTQWFDISDIADPNAGPNPAQGFFGLVDTDGFDSVVFRVDPSFGSSFDVYWLTEMAFSTVVPCPCPGDANGDMVIDFDDLNLVLSNWGTECPMP